MLCVDFRSRSIKLGLKAKIILQKYGEFLLLRLGTCEFLANNRGICLEICYIDLSQIPIALAKFHQGLVT